MRTTREKILKPRKKDIDIYNLQGPVKVPILMGTYRFGSYTHVGTWIAIRYASLILLSTNKTRALLCPDTSGRAFRNLTARSSRLRKARMSVVCNFSRIFDAGDSLLSHFGARSTEFRSRTRVLEPGVGEENLVRLPWSGTRASSEPSFRRWERALRRRFRALKRLLVVRGRNQRLPWLSHLTARGSYSLINYESY